MQHNRYFFNYKYGVLRLSQKTSIFFWVEFSYYHTLLSSCWDQAYKNWKKKFKNVRNFSESLLFILMLEEFCIFLATFFHILVFYSRMTVPRYSIESYICSFRRMFSGFLNLTVLKIFSFAKSKYFFLYIRSSAILSVFDYLVAQMLIWHVIVFFLSNSSLPRVSLPPLFYYKELVIN